MIACIALCQLSPLLLLDPSYHHVHAQMQRSKPSKQGAAHSTLLFCCLLGERQQGLQIKTFGHHKTLLSCMVAVLAGGLWLAVQAASMSSNSK